MPFVKDKPAPSPVIRSKTGTTDCVLSSVESGPTPTLGFGAVESKVRSLEIRTKTTDVNTGIFHGNATVGRLNGGGSNCSGGTGSTTSGGGNALRKARRCWSPELHRRFVSALQQLGGSQSKCSLHAANFSVHLKPTISLDGLVWLAVVLVSVLVIVVISYDRG